MSEKDIEKVILFQIEKTSKTAKQYSQREFDKSKLGITIDQWVLLKIIHEAELLSQKELASKSRRDPASITRTLDILEKKQLIFREVIPNNKRKYNIVLSQHGALFVKQHMPMVDAQREKSVEGFSKEELHSLSNMLQRIQKNMS